MTIQFYCPNCDAIIAFEEKYAQKKAHCTTCNQHFIIPSKSGETAEKIKLKVEKMDPVPGFYRAVFVDSWKLFFDSENAASLVFVIAIVCFKFFLGTGVCCMAFISHVVVWGWLLSFYLNIIYETALEADGLPQIYLGTSITFFWHIIKPFFIFLFTMFVVQMPFIIALAVLQEKGLTIQNMWEAHTGSHLLLQILFIFSLLLFPMAILTTAVGKDITMLLRPDYLLVPVFKAFASYITVFLLLAAAAILETQATQFHLGKASPMLQVGRLAINLAVQILAIIAMRSIGLFYRHYSCNFRW